MSLQKSFESFIKKENLFQPKDELLIAVSGGVDSVVLCELCKQADYNFSIAHCNFKLRGEESEKDERFVRSMGPKYKVEVFVKSFDTTAFSVDKKIGIQEAARNLRYEWFNEIIKLQGSKGNNHILTAHHANDNIETLLINFFRSTGIVGLRSILPKQGNIIRPLLFATKQQILNFASANNLPFAEDSSNSSDKYTRNYFRNQLIPSITKVFPNAENNLQENIGRFREIEMLYRQSINNHKKKLLEQKGKEVHIPILKLQKSQPLLTIIYEIVKDYNFTSHQSGEVLNLLQSETGRFIQSSSHKIIKNRNWLIISPNNTVTAQNILIEESDKTLTYTNGKLKFEMVSVNSQLTTENSIAMLDADEVQFPLLLRKWKTGDYFYPLGMKKKKKLSRFFIDQKMSLTEKENTWLIETKKKIIWVIGKRIDDRFKINPATKNILKISQC